MDIKLGPRIASLRRAKSMTQEQLALSLGVSPPAVSKWETGASCPDISLFMPSGPRFGNQCGYPAAV